MKSVSRKSAGRSRFDSPEQEVFLNLWRCYDCLKLPEDRLFGKHDLSAQQYNALRLLRSVYPKAMPTLALGRRLISRAPDTTRMLDRLNDRGLITRQRLPENRRVVQVMLTPAGLKLLDDMAESVRQMHTGQLGHLSPTDRKELIRLLKLARRPHEDDTCDWLDT